MPAPTRCCIQRCPHNEPLPEGVTRPAVPVYRFPRNPNVCAAWVDAVPHALHLRPESLGICAKHWPPNAKFKPVHNHMARVLMRPDEPPSLFPPGLKKDNVRIPESEKPAAAPVLEPNSLSPQEPSTSSNLKGPYSLRKVKSKQYALMLKGFDLSGDEEEEEEGGEGAEKEEKREEEKLEWREEKKEEVQEQKFRPQAEGERSKEYSISDDSNDSSTSTCSRNSSSSSSSSSCVEVVRERVVRPKLEGRSRSPVEALEPIPKPAPAMTLKLDISTSENSSEEHEDEPARCRLTNGGFTCRRCRAKFPHKQLYLAHRFRMACSRRESRFGCGECRVACGHEEALTRHTGEHTSWGSSQLCLLCRKVVMWKDLFDHLRAHRFGRFGLADC